MYEFPIFKIDTHMGHSFLGRTTGEKHQISLTQVATGDFIAFFELFIGASG
jgi:predicted RNA-binding protein